MHRWVYIHIYNILQYTQYTGYTRNKHGSHLGIHELFQPKSVHAVGNLEMWYISYQIRSYTKYSTINCIWPHPPKKVSLNVATWDLWRDTGAFMCIDICKRIYIYNIHNYADYFCICLYSGKIDQTAVYWLWWWGHPEPKKHQTQLGSSLQFWDGEKIVKATRK